MIATKAELLKDRCNLLPGVDLSTRCRERQYVAQKKAFTMLCIKYFKDHYKVIGAQMDRDHSTVTHYVQTAHFADESIPGFELERKYYRLFKNLINFDRPNKIVRPKNHIQINFLLGFI